MFADPNDLHILGFFPIGCLTWYYRKRSTRKAKTEVTKTRKRSIQNSKTKNVNLENESPKVDTVESC